MSYFEATAPVYDDIYSIPIAGVVYQGATPTQQVRAYAMQYLTPIEDLSPTQYLQYIDEAGSNYGEAGVYEDEIGNYDDDDDDDDVLAAAVQDLSLVSH